VIIYPLNEVAKDGMLGMHEAVSSWGCRKAKRGGYMDALGKFASRLYFSHTKPKPEYTDIVLM